MIASAALPVRLLHRGTRFAAERARNPAFWLVQAMVLLLAITHYGVEYLEITSFASDLVHIHHVPVMLFIFPIVYAGLRFSWEGGLLTGVLCALLTVPNIALWHRQGLDWLVELVNVGTALGVGVVVAMLAEHQKAEHRRAQNLARQLLYAHEEERRRIARDLHDGPAQALVYLLDDLERVLRSGTLDRASADTIGDTRSIVDSALRDVRGFSRDLRPSVLDDLGLLPALEWLARSVTDRGAVDVRLEVAGTPTRLPPEQEIALFRIAQEALHNVERHAEARHAFVNLTFRTDGGWSMRVRDDGRGFDPRAPLSDLVAAGHLGLNGMYERAELAGARLDIQTAPGRGTTIGVVSKANTNAASSSRGDRRSAYAERVRGHTRQPHP